MVENYFLKSDNIWCGQQGGHWGLQGAISCADARPPVAASTGPLTLAGIPSIRSFVAKSTNSRNYRLQWPPWVRMGFKVVNLAPISFGGTKPNGKRLTESFHDWGYWDLPLSYWLTQRVFGVRRGC